MHPCPLTLPSSLKSQIPNDRIDMQLLRLENKEKYEAEFKAKNSKIMEPTLPTSFDYDNYAALNDGMTNVERRRDIRLAHDHPERYCADRCVSTGHCDVLEDFLEMDAKEVVEFCTDCVLSEEEEPCDIPDKMLDSSILSLNP